MSAFSFFRKEFKQFIGFKMFIILISTNFYEKKANRHLNVMTFPLYCALFKSIINQIQCDTNNVKKEISGKNSFGHFVTLSQLNQCVCLRIFWMILHVFERLNVQSEKNLKKQS